MGRLSYKARENIYVPKIGEKNFCKKIYKAEEKAKDALFAVKTANPSWSDWYWRYVDTEDYEGAKANFPTKKNTESAEVAKDALDKLIEIKEKNKFFENFCDVSNTLQKINSVYGKH